MPFEQAYTKELDMVGARKTGVIYSKPVPVDIRSKTAYLALKRFFDIVVSTAALAVLSPVLLVVTILIHISTGAGAFFCQERVGRHGKLFKVYKFRTMKPTAPSNVPTNSLDNAESYITRIGRILRKTSIDELPQLMNVLRGDMSMVGPRPLIKSESTIHTLRSQNGVYQIRPGVTGWAQVNGRDYLSDEEKVALDTEYVRHLGLGLDCRCMWRTILVVFTGRGIAEGRK